LNNGHVNATQVLIDSGADLNKSTMFDRTMLISAAKGGCVEFVRMMIDAGTIDVNTKDKFKRTALSEASDPTIVRLLLSAKADTSLGPALNMSAQNHQPASVKMLLDAGADVNCMIVYHTPLCTAVSTQCEDEKIDDKIAVINLLVDAGASLLRVDRISNSALQICITKWPAQPRVAAALLARDPTLLELRDGTGKTPLQVAVTIKSVEMVRFLISAGADVHKCDKFGVPIVSLAMRRPSYSPTSRTLDTLLLMRETLDVLLAAGADPTACDANGKTAVMEALSPMQALSLDCIIPEESCTRFIAYFSEAILRRAASM
jgi:ankyrin repeat protein